jgi:transposase
MPRRCVQAKAPSRPLPSPFYRQYNGHPEEKRRKYVRLMLEGVTPEVAAAQTNIGFSTAKRWSRNLKRYGSIHSPYKSAIGRPRKLTINDETALMEALLDCGWMYQDEMVFWLQEERGVEVSQPFISALLHTNGWSRKSLQVVSHERSEPARQAYLQDLAQFSAERLVFLDETLFNEKTGWRRKAYAPIGEEARWETSISRGKTHSCLAAMGIEGWLPCWELREGYFDRHSFLLWITEQLLPCIETHFGGERVLIIMDNCSTHVRDTIREAIEEKGHLLRYLPPYSPDLNPIELTFSLLKAWIRRNFWLRRDEFDNFADFLVEAIEQSRCGRFARKQFRHCGKGYYIELAEMEQLMEELRAYGSREIDVMVEEVE